MLRGIKIAILLAAIMLGGCATQEPIYAEGNPQQNAKITSVAIAFQRGPIKVIYYAGASQAEPRRIESEQVAEKYLQVVERIATRQLGQELGNRGIYGGGSDKTTITIRPVAVNVPDTEMKLELTVETKGRPKWAATLTAKHWFSKDKPLTEEGFARIVTDLVMAELVKAGFIAA